MAKRPLGLHPRSRQNAQVQGLLPAGSLFVGLRGVMI
jgi:hypothetical protein